MFKKKGLWYRFLALLLIMMFIIPILAACGGGDEETTVVPSPTSTATSTATATAISTATPTATAIPTGTSSVTPTATSTPSPTTSGNPVKIGAIISWSGPMAVSGLLADQVIKLVEWQVKQQGGILGGRDVKVVRYDDGGSVANAAAGAKKLIDDDKVSVLVFGGSYGAEQQSVSQVAEDNKTLFVTFGGFPEIPQRKFTVLAAIYQYTWDDYWLRLAKMLNAKTVAFMGTDQSDVRDRFEYCKGIMKAAGIDTVYEQYIDATVQDLSSYLTKVKYQAPDILCADFSNEQYTTMGKQVAELGGLGNTKILAMTQAATAATKTKGFEGAYVLVAWMPGMTTPAAIKYEQDYKTVNGGAPNPNHIYYYWVLWTTIYAIEMANTDTDLVKIAEVARSGNLEWDTPAGRAHFTTDGYSGLGLTATQVVGGKLVTVELPR